MDDVLTRVTEIRAKIVRGEDVSIEELREALEIVRQARASLVGAKPPKARVPRTPKPPKVSALEQLFMEVEDAEGPGIRSD